MAKKWTVVMIAGLLSACESAGGPEAACSVLARDVRECATDELPREMCIAYFTDIEMSADAAGCSSEWDAMVDCYGSTRFECSGNNWPDCDPQETALFDCCGDACTRP